MVRAKLTIVWQKFLPKINKDENYFNCKWKWIMQSWMRMKVSDKSNGRLQWVMNFVRILILCLGSIKRKEVYHHLSICFYSIQFFFSFYYLNKLFYSHEVYCLAIRILRVFSCYTFCWNDIFSPGNLSIDIFV